MKLTKFEELKGQTLIHVDDQAGDGEMIFTLSDGSRYKLYHSQDCCESVYI